MVLTSCGGVGTEHRGRTGETATETVHEQTLDQKIKDNAGCAETVREALKNVAVLCAADLNVDLNRSLCLAEARQLRSDHPNFVCTLENGQLVDSDYINEHFILGLKSTD